MPRILWLRTAGRTDDAEYLEKHTGFKVAISGTLAPWRDLAPRVQLILIELPLAPEIVREMLLEVHQAPMPVPVIVYDPESVLDEQVIQPPIAAFHHVTERLSVEGL